MMAPPSPCSIKRRLKDNGSGDEPPQVCIGVTDDGAGMTEEIRSRAFDPFFTTKKRSLSTGLGLSLVHGVVSACGGSVQIESAPNKGTTVTLTLNAAEDEPAAVCDDSSPRRHATISLADPLRAEWVSHVVRLAGYEVERPPNGKPARESCLWVTEPTSGSVAVARRFCTQAGGQVILLGAGGREWAKINPVVVDDPGSLEGLRSAVRAVTPAPEGDA